MLLAHYRKEIGFTQQEVADRIGVHQSAIAQYESGITHPTSKNMVKLAVLLGCTLDELFADEILYEAYAHEREKEALRNNLGNLMEGTNGKI